jgi:hypothetical protein
MGGREVDHNLFIPINRRQLMKSKIDEIIAKLTPGLGGTVVTLVESNQGVVKVKIFVPSCGPAVRKEIVMDLLEEEFGKKLPGFKEVVAVQ